MPFPYPIIDFCYLTFGIGLLFICVFSGLRAIKGKSCKWRDMLKKEIMVNWSLALTQRVLFSFLVLQLKATF